MDKIFLGIMIPFIGTILGGFFVFFIKEKLNLKFKNLLIGFASGVMIAASVWSLIMPSIEQSNNLGNFSWVPATIGLFIGFLFLLVIDIANEKIATKNQTKKKSLLSLSILLHNIPEGMAVGVALAAAFYGNSLITMSSAIALSVGIAIQNIPEGAIVSIPLKLAEKSKWRSFLESVYSAVVEPIFAIITFFVTGFVVSILPYILSFAAGCMLFVVIGEIIPETTQNKYINWATMGFAIGFAIMMILDISLG
jgi:ZIP family zinc transporter